MEESKEATKDVKPKTRHIRLDNSVLASTVAAVINKVDLLLKEDKESPIYLHINTYGGSVYDGLALYDYLRGLPCPVVTIGEGKVMSMGTIILLAGDIKCSLKNTTYMIHEVSSMSWGKLSSLENDMKESKRLNTLLKSIYKSHLKIPKNKVDDLLRGEDSYLTAAQSRRIGLIDKIISNVEVEAWD